MAIDYQPKKHKKNKNTHTQRAVKMSGTRVKTSLEWLTNPISKPLGEKATITILGPLFESGRYTK